MRMVPSLEPDTIRLPSGLKATELTLHTCPLITRMVFPFVAFQIRMVLSKEPDTMRFPSGLKATE